MTIIFIFISAAAAAGTPAQVIPTTYEAGHFYAPPETEHGERLRMLVDTGGGGAGSLYWVVPNVVERLQLKASHCHIDGHDIPTASLPRFKSGQGLPAPLGSCQAAMVVSEAGANQEGMLGSPYLGGRIWTFDYPAQRLTLESPRWKPTATSHAWPMGFERNADGTPRRYFPRVSMSVDGQAIDMLLDTGATAHPTVAGKAVSGTETVDGTGVTSYITHSQFERWHAAHPDWRVVEAGDDLLGKHPMRLIEVPTVELAGWTVGPVWFTERPDVSFHGMMAELMDRTPEGAIGGNVFKHFVMTLDYPHATAYMSCAADCRPATTKERP